jgi:DeoR family transcriptional regulator, glycerol-3-phosphate regulon repressor
MHTLLKPERHQIILEKVTTSEIISVLDLAAMLEVSEITIRRDLDELSGTGLIVRVHGGARRACQDESELSVMQRRQQNVKEKQTLAIAAAKLIEDGDVIALESGSTTLALAHQLARMKWQDLQVVTNSFPILNVLIHVPTVDIVFLGGMVDHSEACTYGSFTENNLSHLSVRKLFTGCRGLDIHMGRTNDFEASLEVDTVEAFYKASEQLIMLADHTKLGCVFPLQLLGVEKIDVLIVSDLTPVVKMKPFADLGIKIMIAKTESSSSG